MKKQLIYVLTLTDWNITEHGSIKLVLKKILGLSNKEISRLKYNGEILLNGKKAYINAHMRVGEQLRLVFPEPNVEVRCTTDLKPVILYENEDLVAVNKPSGITVHPSVKGETNSLGNALQKYYQSEGQSLVVRPIGRLDKEVSGICLFAKNQPAAARLSKQRNEQKMVKEYFAFAEGVFELKEGMIDAPIGKDEKSGMYIVGIGKEARTLYRVEEEKTVGDITFSVLSIELETGRTHQIRAHMAACGHPLLGDEEYGGNTERIQRPALHCGKLECYDPFSDQTIRVKAEIPQDMYQLLHAEHQAELFGPAELNDEQEPKPVQDPVQEIFTYIAPENAEPQIQNTKETRKHSILDTFSIPAQKSSAKPKPEVEDINQLIKKWEDRGDDAIDSPAFVNKKKQNNKLLLAIVLILILIGLLLIILFKLISSFEGSEQKVYDSLKLELKEERIVEYGSQFAIEDYILRSSGEMTSGMIDTNTIGVQTLDVVLSKKNIERTYEISFTVVDTKSPVIKLKQHVVEIDAGDSYNPEMNIIEVYDEVDGTLEYSVDTDFNASEPGDYNVSVTAVDLNKRKSIAEFTITVRPVEMLESDKVNAQTSGTQTTVQTQHTENRSDIIPPVITLSASKVTVEQDGLFNVGYCLSSVNDNEDGDLRFSEVLEPGTYTVTGTIDTSTPGDYEFIVTAEDTSGNRSSETLMVEVLEKIVAPSTVASYSTNKETIYYFFKNNMGFSKAMACGIMANMHRESRFDPTADNGVGYYGICQWGNERLDLLKRWCEENGYDYTSLNGQLNFIAYEFPKYYPNTYAQLTAVDDSAEGARRACWIFAIGYEVAGEEFANMSMDKAEEYYTELF